jgi:hypothetical protein
MENSFIFILVEIVLLSKIRGVISAKTFVFCSETYLGGGVLQQKNNINSN